MSSEFIICLFDLKPLHSRSFSKKAVCYSKHYGYYKSKKSWITTKSKTHDFHLSQPSTVQQQTNSFTKIGARCLAHSTEQKTMQPTWGCLTAFISGVSPDLSLLSGFAPNVSNSSRKSKSVTRLISEPKKYLLFGSAPCSNSIRAISICLLRIARRRGSSHSVVLGNSSPVSGL